MARWGLAEAQRDPEYTARHRDRFAEAMTSCDHLAAA
jgi:hypothetical protein